MAQKFRRAVDPNFTIYDRRDFVRFLPEDQTGVVSHIATPKVNLYKTRLDISGMQFVARDELEDLVLFSNVLSAEFVKSRQHSRHQRQALRTSL